MAKIFSRSYVDFATLIPISRKSLPASSYLISPWGLPWGLRSLATGPALQRHGGPRHAALCAGVAGGAASPGTRVVPGGGCRVDTPLPTLLFGSEQTGGGSTQALLMSGSLLDWGGRPPTWLSRTHDEFSPVILNVVD